MKKIMFKLVITISLFLSYSCDFSPQIEIYDKNLPWETLRITLDQLLVFELNCSSIDYKIDTCRFDDSYVNDFFNYSAESLAININDSVMFNQEYEVFTVPEEWCNQSENLSSESNHCQVYFTKLVESKRKNAIFTYVYIPSLDAKYKILYTKDSNNEWRLSGFGM